MNIFPQSLPKELNPYLAIPISEIEYFYDKKYFFPLQEKNINQSFPPSLPLNQYPFYRIEVSSNKNTSYLLVKKEDSVKKYQTLSQNNANRSYAHSPISGKIIEIETTLDGSIFVVIENDYMHHEYQAPQTMSFLNILSSRGLYGLGGGLYPTEKKIQLSKERNISTLIINLVESEEVTQVDHFLLHLNRDPIILAIQSLMNYHTFQTIVIAFTYALPTWAQLKKILESLPEYNIKVLPIPNVNIAGYEKFLVELLSRKKISNFSHALDHQYTCLNFSTLWHMGDTLQTHKPMIGKYITLAKGGKLFNVFSLYGTYIQDLYNEFFKETSQEISYISNGNKTAPTSNNLKKSITMDSRSILFTETGSEDSYNPCIHCNACNTYCPENLSPELILISLESKQDNTSIEKCIFCNACDHICPSEIPLSYLFKKYLHTQKHQEKYEEKKIIAQKRLAHKKERALRKKDFLNAQKNRRTKNKKNFLNLLKNKTLTPSEQDRTS